MLHWLADAPRRDTPPTAPDRGGLPTWSRLVAVAVAVGVAALGWLWLAGHRSVTLVVDEEAVTVDTHADSVGALLDRAGVEVGPDDHVEPASDAALVHGMRIEVVHAREITLLIGDEERSVVVAALTVDDALAQLAEHKVGEAGRRSLLRPSRGSRVRSGMVVELSDPVGLTVVVGDLERQVVTDAATVGDVLDRLGLVAGPHDRVAPDPDRPTEHGMVVVLERVEIREEIREEALAFPTEERHTDALQQGERREVQAGEDGLRRVIEEVTSVDGIEESRTQVRVETLREPRPRIVDVGTAPAPEEPPAAPAARREPAPEPEVEAAAQPELEPDPDPEPEPEHQPANVEEGKASWYDNPYGGYTAAHRTIPRGTVVTVTNVANGRSVEVRINDRGPFVDGRVIDLNREAFAELAPPSEGVVRVRVEW